MNFLQVALLFSSVLLTANVAAQRYPVVETSCVSNSDCYMEEADCYCIGKGLYNPGQCECTGLITHRRGYHRSGSG